MLLSLTEKTRTKLNGNNLIFFPRVEVYVCYLRVLCRMKGRKFKILSILFNWNLLLSFINPKDFPKGPHHINAFSNENVCVFVCASKSISMRLGLCVHIDTLSVFTENASILKRSWNWIKTQMHTHHFSVNGRKRIKMKAMTENILGTCVCIMYIEFNLGHNVQFYRFWTF